MAQVGGGKEISRKAFRTVLSSEALSTGYQFMVSVCGITLAAEATGSFGKLFILARPLLETQEVVQEEGREEKARNSEGRPAQLALLLYGRQFACSRNLG